jgi:hypothetical protein
MSTFALDIFRAKILTPYIQRHDAADFIRRCPQPYSRHHTLAANVQQVTTVLVHCRHLLDAGGDDFVVRVLPRKNPGAPNFFVFFLPFSRKKTNFARVNKSKNKTTLQK